MNDASQKAWQRQAVGGAGWMGMGTVAAKAAVFLSAIVLAHLLSPEDFGRNAMAVVISNLLITIGTLGTGTALIQRQDEPEAYARCAFSIGLGLGAALTLLQVILAPVAGRFYGEPVVTALLLMTSPIHLVMAAGNTSLALLGKALRFKRAALCNLTASLASNVGSIGLALAGCGVWSLASGPLIATSVCTVLALLLCRWRPRWSLAREPTMNLLRYTSAMLPGVVCLYLNYSADNLIVGWRLGATELGFYSLAYALGMSLPLVFGPVMEAVVFPLFARLQSQPEQLRLCFQHVLGTVAVLGGPVTVWLILEVPLFVPWVFGAKWAPAILPLQIVCVLGLVRALAMQPAAALAKAIGRPDLSSKNAMTLTPLALTGFYFGSYFGVIGVAIAALITLGSGAVIFMLVVVRIAGWHFVDMWPSLIRLAVMALATWVVLTLRHSVWTNQSMLLQVVADSGLVAVIYAAVIVWLGPRLRAVFNSSPQAS